MGLFIFIGVLLIALVIFYRSHNNDHRQPFISSAPTTKNVAVPNPETANPKEVLTFILNHDADAIKQVYTQLIDKGYTIPEKLRKVFQDKIDGKYLFLLDAYWQFDIKDYQTEKENLSQYTKQYYFEIKGLQVHSYQDKLRKCVVYDKVELKKEPHNKYDSNAIKVVADSGMIGHVPAEETAEVSEIMSGDHKAFIFVISDVGGFIDSDVIIYYN